MKLSVSMETLFGRNWTENCAENIATVRKAEYDAIEFLTWWDKDLDAISSAAKDNGLDIACMLTNSPCMGDKSTRPQFLEDLKRSIEAAHKVGCTRLIGQSGLVKMFLSEYDFWQNMIETTRMAAEILEDAGITMIMEPVNTKVDHAGVFLSSTRDSFHFTRMVNSPNVKILFDLYHQQIMDGNLLDTVRFNLGDIGHFHGAGVPGRHELHLGELNYRYIVNEIEKMGYDGYFGMEYRPTMQSLESLVCSRKLLLDQ